MTERLAFPRAELRRRTVRGVFLNAGFLIALDALVLAQGLIVTRVLGPRAIGLYGIVTVTVMTLVALKRVGIDEAFVRQSEPEQEEEFQRAFSLELALAGLVSAVVCALAPVLAVVYGDDRLIALTLATAYLPIAFALQAPLWVFFRRMDFLRQRLLQAVVPVVTFAVTVPLALSGFGVWSLVVGPAAGHVVGVTAALVVSPHRVRWRPDREAWRRYARFSGPLFVSALGALVVQQGQVLAFTLDGGLAAGGFIVLAATLTRFLERPAQIVASTVYPAVCAVQGQAGALHELFEKSNRAALAPALALTALIVLFAPDLVEFVLGEAWRPAAGLLQGLAAATGLAQVAYNWFSFYRAHGRTRPEAVEASAGAAAFVAFAVPGLLLGGVGGFVAGRAAGVCVQLALRARYVRELLPGVRPARIAARAAAPAAAGMAAALAVRLALWGGEREVWQPVLEGLLFAAVCAGVAVWRERDLAQEFRASILRYGSSDAERDARL